MKRSGSRGLALRAPGNGGGPDFELSPIKAIELKANRLADVVSLAQGIPSFDTPEPIKKYVSARIAEGACAKYSLSPGLPRLREAISEMLLRDGMRYDPDGEIIVTCGAIEAIAATLLAFIEPGDEVVLASPTYASYLQAVQLARATPCFAALDEDANFDLDPETIRRAITRRTRAILLCNPNNPTGTIYSPEQTARVMDLAARHDLLVIDDAVYKDFVYTDAPAGNPAARPEHRDRVVRVCSFSKAYGMTGWRVGFLHTSRARADAILRVHDTLVTCAPVVSQYAAIAALELGDPFIEKFRDEFRRRRARIIERLDALPRVFDYQRPNASYFAFPRVKDTVALARDSRALADDILERAHVALVPGVAFGPTGEAHLRFCYARDLADIDRAFDRLTDYFAGKSPFAEGSRTVAARPPDATPSTPEARRAVSSASRLRWTRRVGTEVLHNLARIHLARARPRVVAIAGGQGNTVLKRTLTELLARRFRVRSNPLSYNTEVGLAFSILGTSFDAWRPLSLATGMARALRQALFPDPVDVLVLELGTRRRGDIERLLRVVRPSIAVITPLAPSYADDHETLAVLRTELGHLIETARRSGAPVVYCADDADVATLASGGGGTAYGEGDLVERDGAHAVTVGGREYPLGREVVGRTSLYALLASAAVARALGVGEEAVGEFLAG